MCAIGWQCANATAALAVTQQLQGLIALNAPFYIAKPWHSTLFCIAVAAFASIWNTVSVQKLPLIERIGMVFYVLGFLTLTIILWTMAPHENTRSVWTNFEDNSGWGNVGLSTLVGILGPLVTLIGSDSSCHLSEETVDAAWVLPRAMVATATINYIIGFVMTITIMSSLGDDVSMILSTTYGQPWIQVLFNATRSTAGTSILAAVVCALLLLCLVNSTMTTSRQLFAFSRDQGLPFSDWLGYVSSLVQIVIQVFNHTRYTLYTTFLSMLY